MSRIIYFMQNPVQSSDGFSLRAADAVEVEKFFNVMKKRMRGGGFLQKPLSPPKISDVENMLYHAFGGRVPAVVVKRICQPDILKFFGLGYSKTRNISLLEISDLSHSSLTYEECVQKTEYDMSPKGMMENLWRDISAAQEAFPSTENRGQEQKPPKERALCINCGSFKGNAFERCVECEFAPSEPLEGAMSCLFTIKTQSKEYLEMVSGIMKVDRTALLRTVEVDNRLKRQILEQEKALQDNPIVMQILNNNKKLV